MPASGSRSADAAAGFGWSSGFSSRDHTSSNASPAGTMTSGSEVEGGGGGSGAGAALAAGGFGSLRVRRLVSSVCSVKQRSEQKMLPSTSSMQSEQQDPPQRLQAPAEARSGCFAQVSAMLRRSIADLPAFFTHYLNGRGRLRHNAAMSGRSFPAGPRLLGRSVNFSLYSRHAESMELVLFDHAEDPVPSRVIPLHAATNRTYHYWHVDVPDIGAGQVYGWRARGPFDPERGLRFDPGKLLLDPYARAVVVPKTYSRPAACVPGDTTATGMRGVVADFRLYDWEGDRPPRTPFSATIIYEMHVGGFTKSPTSGLDPGLRGTYRGMIAKIPYLKELGVTAVELMPVFQFDEQDAPQGRRNYWGYAPVSFFAPHAGYSSRRDALGPLDEFRDLVKALHRAGIEV